MTGPVSRDNDSPADPMTVLAQGAVQMHEVFLAYIDAGFTDGQAITLVAAMISATIRNQNGGGPS